MTLIVLTVAFLGLAALATRNRQFGGFFVWMTATAVVIGLRGLFDGLSLMAVIVMAMLAVRWWRLLPSATRQKVW